MGAEGELYVDSQGNVFQLGGFQNESALGTYVDSQGNVFEAGADGNWSLTGLGESGEFVRTEDGQLYQLNGSSGTELAGFQNSSALGMPPAASSNGSSFGYAPR
jgi:hypothetical protein